MGFGIVSSFVFSGLEYRYGRGGRAGSTSTNMDGVRERVPSPPGFGQQVELLGLQKGASELTVGIQQRMVLISHAGSLCLAVVLTYSTAAW